MSKIFWLIITIVSLVAVVAGCTRQSSTATQTTTPLVMSPVASPPVTSGAGNPGPNPTIVIKYTPDFVMQNTVYYLILSVSIENHGYNSFNTALEYFSVSVSNVKYFPDPDFCDLKMLDIINGGKLNGKLAFQVPTGTPRVGYKLSYTGTRVFNIFLTEVKR